MLFSIKRVLNLLRKNKLVFVLSFILGGIFLLPEIVLAQDLGFEYGEAIGLPSTDPRLVIARLIQIVLGFLGILALSLIVYGGFMWMTSAGNQEKIDRAKKVLKNAIIGLIIILSSFGIVTFVLNSLLDSMGLSQTGPGVPDDPSSGLTAIGACSVQSVYPEPQQEDVPRNTSVMITFNEPVDPSTVCESLNAEGECEGSNIITDGRIRIYRANDGLDNFISDVSVSQTSNNRTFVFTPHNYLGSPSEHIWYGVELYNDILKTNGEGVFTNCQGDGFGWQFEVSDELNLTPPYVESIFPPPDDEQDEVETTSDLSFAQGEIRLLENPSTYVPATYTGVTPLGGSSDDFDLEMDPGSEQEGSLLLAIESDGSTATLQNTDTGANLGSSQFQGGTVSFSGILEFTVNESYEAGNSWEIEAVSRQDPDHINIDSDTYTFVDSASQSNHIEVGANIGDTVFNVASRLDSRSDLEVSPSGDIVEIQARTGGSQGNDITIEVSDESVFDVDPMSGGEDEVTSVNVNDRPDQPINAIIQIEFNEAINPITVSGSADELADRLRVVNADSGANLDGQACSQDNDCLSFDCSESTGQCVGNHLAGRFISSNSYRTVEFQSDNRCGTNACGEDIYCLPENANIRVELEAAQLDGCPDDCSARSPFNECVSASGSFVGQVCHDSNDNLNYPMAHLPPDGIVDAASNSLDGNRDGLAEGPVSYYDENLDNTDEGDSYTWSFWTSDELRIGAPEILSTNPNNNGSSDNLIDPIEVEFDTLMQSSSLRSGEVRIDTGEEVVPHKAINLWSLAGGAVGYWINNEGIEDEPPFDGYPNKTKALIGHSMLGESVTYRTQVGSGVRDIYQNCYMPSDGPACTGVNEFNPSCCAGVATPEESCP